MAELDVALTLDPVSLITNDSLGEALMLARRYDESAAQFLKTLDMDSRFVRSRVKLAGLYRLMGRIEDSFQWIDEPRASEMADTYRRLGWRGLLVSERDRLVRQVETRYIGATGPAAMYAALDDRERAFEWLERAYRERDRALVFLKVHPSWDALREDPRFQQLIARMSFPSDSGRWSARSSTLRRARLRNRSLRMRIALVIVAFSVAMFSIRLTGQEPQVAPRLGGDEAEILRLDREYHVARSRADAAAVNRFLASDYYTINTNGERREASNVSGGPTPGGFPWQKFDLCDHRVRVYGDTAVSTYHRQFFAKTPRGGFGQTDLVGTHVWVRRGDRWLLALSHTTEIAEPQPEGCNSSAPLPK